MKKVLLLITISLLLAVPGFAEKAPNGIFIKNAKIHTITKGTIENGNLLVVNGKIKAVGSDVKNEGNLPELDAKGMDLYPGFIDASTGYGLMEIWSVPATLDYQEVGDFNPDVKAAWAYKPNSIHTGIGRTTGVTTALVNPSGGLFSGIGAIVKLDGWTIDEALVEEDAVSILNFPESPSGDDEKGKKAKLIEKKIKKIKDILKEARRYHELKKLASSSGRHIPYNQKYEALGPVLEGKLPLIVNVKKAEDIKNVLKFKKEEKLNIILKGCEQGYMVADEIKKSGIPVILGSLSGGFGTAIPTEPEEAYDAVWANPGKLAAAGVKVTFSTGSPISGKDLPFHAARAVAFGMDREEALRAITINAAQILGLDDRLGSIETGKDADFFLCSGDPLDLRTEVKHVFINGKDVDLSNWWEELREKWEKRPLK